MMPYNDGDIPETLYAKYPFFENHHVARGRQTSKVALAILIKATI